MKFSKTQNFMYNPADHSAGYAKGRYIMKIIAVTSCATGIAHSYMSAEAIKKAAKAKGHSCKVEIQGALGIENQLSKKDIDSADLVILANDVGLTKAERFENVPKEKIRKFSPHEIIKKPDIIFE